jgi:hypothetical protein
MTKIMSTETSFTRHDTANLGEGVYDGHEALALAGIDWTVEKLPLSTWVGGVKNAEKHTVNVRSTDGAIMGTNGKRYTVIQNSELAEFGNTVRKFRPDARFIGGGSSMTGELVFLQMELDDPIFFGDPEDVGRRRLIFANDHNGNSPLYGAGVAHRIGCMNQWTGMLKDQRRIFRVSHTMTAKQRIAVAHHAVIEAVRQFDEVDAEIERLLNTPSGIASVTTQIIGDRPTEAGRALTEWEKRLDALYDEYKADFNANLQGTALGIVMAAQGVDEHGGRQVADRTQQRVNRILTANYPMMQKALACFA